MRKFNRVEKFNYKKNFFELYIDKNDSVYDILKCDVLSFKTIEKGRKKISVPDQVVKVRDMRLFDHVKGNPTKIAVNKIAAYIDYNE